MYIYTDIWVWFTLTLFRGKRPDVDSLNITSSWLEHLRMVSPCHSRLECINFTNDFSKVCNVKTEIIDVSWKCYFVYQLHLLSELLVFLFKFFIEFISESIMIDRFPHLSSATLILTLTDLFVNSLHVTLLLPLTTRLTFVLTVVIQHKFYPLNSDIEVLNQTSVVIHPHIVSG